MAAMKVSKKVVERAVWRADEWAEKTAASLVSSKVAWRAER